MYALLVIYKSFDSFYVERSLVVENVDYVKIVELKENLERLNKRDDISYKIEEIFQFDDL